MGFLARYRAKRELMTQTVLRYQEVGHYQKSVILDVFVAATSYTYNYAIRLLACATSSPITIFSLNLATIWDVVERRLSNLRVTATALPAVASDY